ncbi:hypothetical protein GCM10009737_29200 [Nocardioides lentus]|uniref:Nudix hydrolase domain-containing protein n=1 Tax=Nocardioides lentus TaxID=338077 RepID=A0ABN2PMA1_9ACTN
MPAISCAEPGATSVRTIRVIARRNRTLAARSSVAVRTGAGWRTESVAVGWPGGVLELPGGGADAIGTSLLRGRKQ